MHVVCLEGLGIGEEFPGCASVGDGAGGFPAADQLVGDFAGELVFCVAVLGEDRYCRAGRTGRGGECLDQFEDVG